MKPAYGWAIAILAVGLFPLALALFGRLTPGTSPLVLPAVALPLTLLLLASARFGHEVRPAALAGGGLVAPLIALASQPLVIVFAVLFFLGFGESGRKLLDALRLAPQLTTALSSPWVVFALIEIAAIVPFVEEFAKALGATFSKPTSRREAFIAGVQAGCAFAAIENVLYALAAARFGGPWAAVVAVRMLGVAVHPLGCGLTMLGWWEWKRRGAEALLLRRYLSAAGIHMLWNGSTTVAAIAAGALIVSDIPRQMHMVALSYAAVLGVVLAAVLWQVAETVAAGEESDSHALRWNLSGGEALAAWASLAATLLVPVGILVLAFPKFYLG